MRVLQHDLECFGHLLGSGTTAHVEKVRRAAPIELGNVHGRHRQAGAVDEAADIAVERDVREIEFRRLDFRRVFFIEVAHGDDVGMTEQRVVVEIHLGVERDHVAAASQNQRIDFGERRVGLVERFIKALQRGACFRQRRFGYADLARDGVGLAVREAARRINENLVDFAGRFGGDFLDVHAAFAARHQAHALGAAIHHHAEVELLLDIRALFDQQAPHFLPLRTGLMRLEHHAEDLACMLFHFVDGSRKLYAAALAATAGMNLRLHDPHLAAQTVGRRDRFVDAEARYAAGGGDTELAQDFFGLVFVYLHLQLST